VVIAPDSFKGTLDAVDAAQAMATGWLMARPQDEVVCLPQADGGEGTAEALAMVSPGASWHDVGLVAGPDGRPVPGRYLTLSDGTAVVDLATSSGIALMKQLDPLGAHTEGLGQVIRAAVADGARRLVIGLGGSASTDGGLGALVALGARALGSTGERLPNGGGALTGLGRIDPSGIVQTPPGGVELLTDVTSPLLGPTGAAAVFGPQKGASAAQIDLLDRGLARLAEELGGDPDQPGAGAAGGTAYGLVAGWGATITPGARRIAELTGLVAAAATADVLILGEGRFDATSLSGKVVGEALALARDGARRCVIAGQVATDNDALAGVELVSLTELAGSAAQAMADPGPAMTRAARGLARATGL
jgi:glycerate kinase